ncbi:insecticidal delta-endotoxin Cry8Ea1 family protein [Bacillus sp. SRB3LM]|uniref:insecticidal delta-endotoxin Cry8Ea1 family protein n=1 Tax=Bacillus sp. SRB3LM TaxID=2608689 RepID=UPI0018C3CAB0|nr:insecticidal delta-endotoxin Cry8Ea1 family protein [Bacillus sp. SRB3LM]MBG0972908.1 hypothetical protein [Bacillus sp. SRB3LM]
MNSLQEQSIIPYNVLVSPPRGTAGSQFGDFEDLITSLKEAWVEFQKTGSDKLLTTVLQNGFSAASGGSFNYLAVLQAGIGILGTVLGAEIPGVAVAAPILSMVIGWLWPHSSKDDTQQLINLIDAEIQKQLNQALSNQDKNNWQGYLNAIFTLASEAADTVVDAQFTGVQGDQNRQPRQPSPSDYVNVYNELVAANSAFIIALSQMVTGNFDTLAIPFFVIGATVQLSTYQSFIQFANKWINVVYPDQTQGDGLTQKQNLVRIKGIMRTAIHDNTQKVFDAFKSGMPSLGSDKASINAYNVYIRGMLLNGLDMVATWPSMYPDDYTSQTELEQTRVIFSDLVGQDQSRNGNVTIRNILDNTTSYQHGTIDFNSIFYFPDELQKVQTRVYSYNHGSYCGDCYCWPYGVILNYPSNTYRYGDNDPGTSGDHWQNAPITNINAATQHTTYVDGENMWGDVSSFSGCNLPGYCSGDCSPGGSCPSNNGYFQSCNSQLPNQKINALYPFTQTNVSGASGKLGVMASFVPYGLSPNNVFGTIDPDTLNIVGKGFPAEKGFLTNGNRPVVVREWVNGANAVNLTPGNTLLITATNLTAGKYKVRVRYANAGTTTASLTQSVVANGGQIQGGGWGFKSTTNANIQANFPNQVYVSGQQGNYVVQDISWPAGGGSGDPLTLPSGNVVVALTLQPQETNTQVFIDRIELVPVSQPTQSSDNIINYTITSPLWAYWNESGVGPDNFPTIWTASSGENGVSASINATNLDNNVTFIAMNGDDWSSAVPMQDATGDYSISNGDYILKPYGDQPFTVIKIGSYSSNYVTRGTITGTVNIPQN